MALPINLFNADWYLAQNPDVAGAVQSGIMSAEEHFHRHGAAEGRAPGPLFDPQAYLAANPDVAQAVAYGLISAYEHFFTYGMQEDRSPLSLFEPGFYLAHNPDVAAAVEAGLITATQHFLLYGQGEPRQINPFINLGAYMDANADIAHAAANHIVSPLMHMLSYGASEGRDLGNGIHLAVFGNDPTFNEALARGDIHALFEWVSEVAPFLQTFQKPPGWEPAPDTRIPIEFIPLLGITLEVPPSVVIPPGTQLPDTFQQPTPPAPAPSPAPPPVPDPAPTPTPPTTPGEDNPTPPPFAVTESSPGVWSIGTSNGGVTLSHSLDDDTEEETLTFTPTAGTPVTKAISASPESGEIGHLDTIEVAAVLTLTVAASDLEHLPFFSGGGTVVVTDLQNAPDADLSRIGTSGLSVTVGADAGVVDARLAELGKASAITIAAGSTLLLTGEQADELTMGGDGAVWVTDLTAKADLNGINVAGGLMAEFTGPYGMDITASTGFATVDAYYVSDTTLTLRADQAHGVTLTGEETGTGSFVVEGAQGDQTIKVTNPGTNTLEGGKGGDRISLGEGTGDDHITVKLGTRADHLEAARAAAHDAVTAAFQYLDPDSPASDSDIQEEIVALGGAAIAAELTLGDFETAVFNYTAAVADLVRLNDLIAAFEDALETLGNADVDLDAEARETLEDELVIAAFSLSLELEFEDIDFDDADTIIENLGKIADAYLQEQRGREGELEDAYAALILTAEDAGGIVYPDVSEADDILEDDEEIELAYTTHRNALQEAQNEAEHDLLSFTKLVDALRDAQAAESHGEAVPSDSPATGGWDVIENFQLQTDELWLPHITGNVLNGDFSAEQTNIANLDVSVSAEGIATFSGATAATASPEQKIKALLNAMGTTAGAYAAFTHGGDTYVVQNDGIAGMQSTDTVVQLTGVMATKLDFVIDLNL